MTEHKRPLAYNQGYYHGFQGNSWGLNPHNPDSEALNFEAWCDGWAEGRKQMHQSNLVTQPV